MRAKGLLVVIGGPTASGKTAVAAAVAKHFSTEVISADSRQFYRAMRIGTARPTPEEMIGVKHHFIGHLELQQTWSAGTFARHAEPVLQQLLAQRGIAVMAGGSGLYIDAVCRGLDPLPPANPPLRKELHHRLHTEGLEALVNEFERLDPDHARVIDRRNPHRVIRALEVCLTSGRPYSTLRKGRELRKDIRMLRIALDWPREALYARINERTDRMIAEGLEEEARGLLPHNHLNALLTTGYREFLDHFNGNTTREQAIERIKQNTRNYAKRQLTWLRRDSDWQWMDPTRTTPIIQVIDRALRQA